MLSTKKFEQWLKAQAQMIVRYRQVEKSEVLAEYHSLKHVVDSAEFQAKKKELITTRYADTQEGKTMDEYKRLCKKSSVFFYRLFKKEAWKEKEDVAKYLTLVEQIQTPEFKQANAFWKNKKRWFTTHECQQEKRLNVLAKHSDIVFYLQHSEQEVAQLETYKLVWSEEFETSTMNEMWETGYLYQNKELNTNLSHVSERQAYTQGKNSRIANSALSILTKKQKITTTAWHPTKGMIPYTFAFTSDIWHTKQTVAPKKGVVQVKVRATGKAKHTLCFITAQAEKVLPILSKQVAKAYTIYTLVWNEKEVINYVNDQEVSRGKNALTGEALHLLVRSYLPDNQKAGTAQLDIDWIRIYTNA